MAAVGLVINIGVKVARFPDSLVIGVGKLVGGFRKLMRTFRDFVIVGYGVRRGFDLIHRTITKTFEAAGGDGVKQLTRLSQAWGVWLGDIGRTIQKSATFQVAMRKITSAFGAGISEEKQKDMAKSFDDMAVLLLDSLGGALDKIGYAWDAISNKITGVQKQINDFTISEALLNLVSYKKTTTPTPSPYAEHHNRLYPDEISSGRIRAREPGEGQNYAGFGAWAAGMQGKAGGPPGAGEGLRELAKQIKEMRSGKQPELGGLTPFAVSIKATLAGLDEMGNAITKLGDQWATVMGNFADAATDSSVGIKEAFKGLGKDARKTFVAQMSESAFDPLKQSFNTLAVALATPFRIVGQVIDQVLVAPIANFIAGLLTQLVTTIVEQFVTLKATSDAFKVSELAENAALSEALIALYTPAAVASAIASAGVSLAAGDLAIAQIQASRIPLAAEGGIVMPRPGGSPVIVGEGGRPEAIIPLDQGFPKGLGGGRVQVVVYGNLESRAQNRRLARDLGRQIYDEGKSTGYGKSRRRRV